MINTRHSTARPLIRQARAWAVARLFPAMALPIMLALSLLLAGLILAPGDTLARSARMAHGDVTGVARVLDGDTIEVDGVVIRLNGIDAEEVAHFGKPSEPHGEAARAGLQQLVGIAAPVRCALNGERTHDRLVAICFNARGQDIAAELIRLGLALDCAHYSGGRYRALEPPGARERLIQKPYCQH